MLIYSRVVKMSVGLENRNWTANGPNEQQTALDPEAAVDLRASGKQPHHGRTAIITVWKGRNGSRTMRGMFEAHSRRPEIVVITT